MLDEKAKVIEHADRGEGYRLLALYSPQIASAAMPGQFVHVKVPALEASALRRPFSIFDADAETGTVRLLYKRVGRGTAALNAVKPGEELFMEGPLGKGFPLECTGVPLMAGGGYGVAPLYFLAKKIMALKGGVPPSPELFVGGRTKTDILARNDFAALGVPVAVATNDGSDGDKGFVTVPLDRRIAALKAENEPFTLYACGPDGMLKAVADRALESGTDGWISMDRHMICGVGACYACIQKTTSGNARCCIDGPVFAAKELVW